MTKTPILLALALLLAPPLADAHIEAFSQAKPLTVGPYNAIVEPKPSPMFANSALSMSAIFSRTADGTYVTRLPATLVLVEPSGEQRTAPMEPDGTGYLLASIAVSEPGNYTARILVEEDGRTHSNETTFEVYPDLPIRIVSADPSQSDPAVGEPYAISIKTVGNVSLRPVDAVDDLSITLERWTDDHTQMLDADTYPMTRAGAGLWRLDHVFPVKGMYHLRFSSNDGGFKTTDVPILHVYALNPLPQDERRESPLPALAALGALALGAALLARRR